MRVNCDERKGRRIQKGRRTYHQDGLLVGRLAYLRARKIGRHVCYEVYCILVRVPRKDGRDSTTVWLWEIDCWFRKKHESATRVRAEGEMSNGMDLLVSSCVFGS